MLLLIPGPVATRPEVRAAMAQDYAPWDDDFRALFRRVIARAGRCAGAIEATHSTLPLQGCGHFITESALRGFLPPGGRILIPQTGAYADRMTRLAREAGRVVVPLPVPADARVDPGAVAAALAADSTIGHVGLVYSETGSGVIHDPAAVGAVVRAAGRRMILDAISAYGALPLDLAAQPEIDAVVFTANKCLEGLPGLSFCLARDDRLDACVDQNGTSRAGSWSFDLADIRTHLRRTRGGSRFTPSAQAIAALDVALGFHEAEGQPARLARYTGNLRTLYDGVLALGLSPCLSREMQGPVVMNVHAPDDPAWDLQRFVEALKARGVLISNFYNTEAPSFRVGCIGAVTPDDMRRAVAAIGGALDALGIRNRAAAAAGSTRHVA